MVIPEEIKKEYPFSLKSFQINDELKMNYIDEGIGPTIVMVHGNPTWSFYYRNLIKELKSKYRVIVPDHIGMGLSSKPQEYSYRLEDHIKNLESLLIHLNVTDYSLVVHDWGGAIGIGNAIKNPQKLKSLVIINTAAFTSSFIAKSINFCRIPYLGEWLIRQFNAFAYPATFMAVNKKLPSHIKNGYLLPYDSYKNRIATAKFVSDIPMNKNHQSFKTLKRIESKLTELKCPKLIMWGMNDFCFTDYFLDRWQKFYPDAETIKYENAGHYLLEDEFQSVGPKIENFFNHHLH